MAVRSLNKVMLIGNLTRDPELRYTPQGTAVCTFGLATNRSWTPADGGEKQEETEFHRVVAWSKLAEICSQLLYKGRKVFVEGRLQTRRWQTQEGTERETTEVVIDNMIALGAPKGGVATISSGEESDFDMAAAVVGQAPSVPAGVKATSVSQDDSTATSQPSGTKKAGVKKAKKTEADEASQDVASDDIPF